MKSQTELDSNAAGKYHGYYENEHGEQALFVYDRHTKTGTLWMGDAGWEKPVKVIDALAPELILSDVEEMWLQASGMQPLHLRKRDF